jgi:acyl-coenzyme A synthetase/AMP-(fatty) acid ligase
MTNLAEIIFSRNKHHSGKVAFVENNQTITYGELENCSRRVATWMHSQGIKPGDRVCIVLNDKIDTVPIFLATVLIGAVAVIMNPRLKLDRLQKYVDHISPSLIYCEDNLVKQFVTYNIFTTAQVITDSQDIEPWYKSSQTSLDDVAVILYTSGTAGISKPVMHSHNNAILQSQIIAADTLNITASDKLFSVAKIFFPYGGFNFVMLGTLWTGAEAYLLNDISSPVNIRKILLNYRPTIFFGVSVIYSKLIQQDQFFDINCRCYHGGDKLPQILLDKWKTYTNQTIHNLLGVTECFSIALLNRNGNSPALGTVTPGFEVRIVDDNNKPVNFNVIGNLQIKSIMTGLGYFGDPELTNRVFKEWITTGDLCYEDADHQYYFVGRATDVIKINGQFINPSEIEEVLLKYKNIAQVAVVPVPDKNDIDQIEAFIVPVANAIIDIVSLKQWMIANYEKHLCPKIFHIVEDFPRTDTGKIERYKLKSLA